MLCVGKRTVPHCDANSGTTSFLQGLDEHPCIVSLKEPASDIEQLWSSGPDANAVFRIDGDGQLSAGKLNRQPWQKFGLKFSRAMKKMGSEDTTPWSPQGPSGFRGIWEQTRQQISSRLNG
jgi:hypothetical protein